MARTHWSPPDIGGDILAEALRPDAAAPVAIHVRPGIHALMRRQAGVEPAALIASGSPECLDGIRLVVDDQIPVFPGYEIHRAVSQFPGRVHRHPSGAAGPSRVAALPFAA